MKTILTTERLLIREFGPDDWQDVYEMNTSKDVMREIADGKIKSPEEEKAGFDRILQGYINENGLGVWAVITRVDGTFIGAASMTPLKGAHEIQLGYTTPSLLRPTSQIRDPCASWKKPGCILKGWEPSTIGK